MEYLCIGLGIKGQSKSIPIPQDPQRLTVECVPSSYEEELNMKDSPRDDGHLSLVLTANEW